VDWINLAQDRVRVAGYANTLITFGFDKRLGISRSAEVLPASQEGQCSVELVSNDMWRGNKLMPLV
jgi:hypothetical protein